MVLTQDVNEPFFIKPDLSPQNVLLMESLCFTEEILYQNQDGFLTEQQQQSLWKRFNHYFYELIPPVVILLVTIGIDVFIRTTPVCSVFGTCLLVAWAMGISNLQHRVYKDIKARRVERVQGAVHVSYSPTDLDGLFPELPHTLWMDKRYFRLSERAAAAFVSGDVYTVYYVPNSKTVLCAEHMPEESPRRVARPAQLRRDEPEKPASQKQREKAAKSRKKHAQANKGLHRKTSHKPSSNTTGNRRPTANRGHRGHR